ncbi:FAD-binding oxidoreductase [Robbsia andropogonis]|uniref:FAD-binding oxidoreductase n=1 Tax=Robbsia andropogonis TaxID=28092 RepID=UPI002A6B6361|nr:FAD-binding oxidoreductase [Robbsia andropogonis]
MLSFDGGVGASAHFRQPDRYRFWSNTEIVSSRIARGAGLSYAGASFVEGGDSIGHLAFDRVLDFDPLTGIVEVECGISLAALHGFLQRQGRYLSIQPGHGAISIGGCIAADVHGKNHAKEGTFHHQVESVRLWHPAHGELIVSRAADADVFDLTCGGYGLTGHLLTARLYTAAMPSQSVRLTTRPFDRFESGITALHASLDRSDFSYTWHDFINKGDRFGSGYLTEAQFVATDTAADMTLLRRKPSTLSADTRARLPINLLGNSSARLLNYLYRRKQERIGLGGRLIGLEAALYPAQQVESYFRLFGRPGFHEYQALLPHDAAPAFIDAIATALVRSPCPVTLASAKLFVGPRSRLRFSGDGVCLALNFPRHPNAEPLLQCLDMHLVEFGGLPNIIKDSRLPREVAEACYPEMDAFRAALRGFDAKRLFRSTLSERLGL